ncbi:hypothetical protein HHI36_004027 [Cryptolaemus montrouzieri]|uniref:C2 domain-containing protein n=1 Tax=Cryptolaemus montrouzieri TaxID=559131 RepID=A0ABD2NQ78_9CUCU
MCSSYLFWSDEVIEYNGRVLQGKTYQEVAEIIAESKLEPTVELIVSRKLKNESGKGSWKPFTSNTGQAVYWQQEGDYDRPSVLVTSPGSPERVRPPQPALAPSVGGRIQVRLAYDSSTLQLLVTVVCGAGLSSRGHQNRNPYCKLFLLPDRSEKSKRRTKTLAGTTEPVWNQTFVYSGLRRSDLRIRALEITVWDLVPYGANDFLGETVIELWPLDENPMWRNLGPHEEVALTPSEHLSPPSTGSRFSDSDTPSECEIEGNRERRGADGASVSSVGSSSSPPRENDRRSRRDQEPMTNYIPQQTYKKTGMAGHRSHSAAPCDSPSYHMSRSRSKSPRRAVTDHRSLSPPDVRILDCQPTTYNASRFQSRSATATPTGSPKKRQLPQVPHALARALQERVAQDLDDRSNRQRMRYIHTYRSTGSGWERRYSGLSDSDLANHTRTTRRSLSPDRDRDPLGLVDFDSDMESVASVTSSAFSTQSERPLGNRAYSSYYHHHSSEYPSGSNRYNSSNYPNNRGPTKHREYRENRDYRDQREHRDHRNQEYMDPVETLNQRNDDHYQRASYHHHHHREGSVKRGQFTRSLSNSEPPPDEKTDGSLSDTAVCQLQDLDIPSTDKVMRKESQRDRNRDRQDQLIGLGKKSNSTSQLSATGR